MKGSVVGIKIWKSKIIVPKKLTIAVNAYDEDLTGLRDQSGVEIDSIAGVKVVVCDGDCGWHDDAHYGKYSCLYVLRNDTSSWVESLGVPSQPKQPVGTMILLRIEKDHRLTQDTNAPKGAWIAATIDYNRLPSQRQCIIDMKNSFLKAQ